MESQPAPPETREPKRTGTGRATRWKAAQWKALGLAALAVLTLLAAVGVLLAPVVADDPVVSWPPAGQQPRSTVLPLVPYRPLSLDARVPCAALAALDQQPGGGEVLRTLPASAGRTGTISQGLLVTVRRGVVAISASGKSVMREVLPAPGCSYRVLAQASGVRVLRDGMLRGAAPVRVPQVSELSTDLEGRAAATGLAVSLHLDARYESTPTSLKISLLVVCLAALLVLLGLAWRWWRGGQVAPIRVPRPRVADAVLMVVSGVWVLLAPTNFDDSWYALMARGADASGSVGNAIYMFNVSETPFVASQYVLQAWGSIGGWGLTWLRLVPLGYGLITWLLLRVFLVTGFGRELDTARVAFALLVAYLLWWLPYGMTLRPEPLIVLLAAATLLLAELARRRRSMGALAAASVAAALAMSVSPSGLVAAAPLVLAVPWWWTWLRDQDAMARLAAVLLLVAAAGTSLVLVGCADATLGDVLEATAVHQWYYQAFPWYQEYVHYQTILSFKDSSQWARRAPVVLTLAVLALVAMGSVRQLGVRGRAADPLRRLLVSSAVCSALALALLAPTPTKFVNHFGAVAAAPTVLLAAALVRSPLVRSPLVRSPLVQWPLSWSVWRSTRFRLAVAGTALMIGAVSWSFAGPNIWRPYSDRGQPFGNHLTLAEDRVDLVSVRPRLGPVQLANPLLWVVVALVAAWWVSWWSRRGRDREHGELELSPDRAVLLAGSTAIVAMTLVVFGWAPLRQYPGWSVALSALRSTQGQPCALSDYAQVLLDSPTQPVPTGSASRYGSFAAAGLIPPVPPPVPGTLVWQDAATTEVGSDVPGDPGTGSLIKPGGLLVTPWFTLPAQGGTALVVPVLGARTGQRLTLEYATATGPDPRVVGSVALTVDRTTPDTEWQQAAVALEKLGTARPSSVRLVVHERVSSADNRFAVGQPRLAGWRPLRALTATAPVYVDQLTATLLPCLDQVGIEHGIAQAPQVLVLSDEGFGRGFLDLGFELHRGGTQVPVSRSATTVRIPTRLMPNGAPSLPWGRVVRVVYDHPVGLVDRHVDQQRRAGWTRLPTLAAKSYHGDPP